MNLESRMREKSHCGVCGKNDCQCVVNGISINKYLTLADALTIAKEYVEEMQLKVNAYERAIMILVGDADRHLKLTDTFKDSPESVEFHKRKAKERKEAVDIITLNRDLFMKFPQFRTPLAMEVE